MTDDDELPIPSFSPPQPLGRKPRLTLPPGACDTHCHVLGPWRQFPYAANRPYTPHDVPKEQLFALHAHLGIERGIVVQASPHGTDHGALLNMIAAAEGRYRGVALVDEAVTDKMLEDLHAGGIRAVRFHAIPHLAPMPPRAFLAELAKRIHSLGWHLVVHVLPETLDAVEPFLDFGVPVLIDHMGRIDAGQGVEQEPFSRLLGYLRNDHCWIKIGCADRTTRQGSPYADVIPIARALIEAAPDRTVWSTDYPHPNHTDMPDDADLVDFLGNVAPEPDILRKVATDNPARLYGFQ
jgi:2-pyrone-4,6-dicarboxylate lactonase